MISIDHHPAERGTYRMTAEQRFPVARSELFPFFADAFNLEKLTPGWLKFSVVTPAPIEMREGTLIDYKLALRGLPIRWRTRITGWEPPVRFVDEQLRGPYRLWRHEHLFVDDGENTLARDIVDYRVPGGAIVHSLLVRRDIEKIFKFRFNVLAEMFGEVASGS